MWFPVAHSSATMVPFCKIKVTYYWQTFSGCCHLDFQSSTFQVFWYKAYWVVSQHAHWVSGDLKSPAFQFFDEKHTGYFNALEKSPVCMALISFSPTCGKPSLCFHFRVLSWQHHQRSTNSIVYEIPWKMYNNTLKDTMVTSVSSTKPKTNTIRMNGFITM